MTPTERKQLADRLDSLLVEADESSDSTARQYGHLRGAIKILAAAIEAGTFPERQAIK